MQTRDTPGSGNTTGQSARKSRSMTNLCMKHCNVCGKKTPGGKRSAIFSKRRRRPSRTSCRAVRLDSPAAHRVSGASLVPEAGGLTQWLLGGAWSPVQHPRGRRSAGAGEGAALLCAGAWHLRHTPPHASLGAGGTAGQPAPYRARAGSSGPALHNAAPVPSAHCRGARTDGSPAPAQEGVYGARTRYRLRWGYSVPSDRCRLAVACHRPRSVLAGGGRVGNGQSEAGGVGAPGLGKGAL